MRKVVNILLAITTSLSLIINKEVIYKNEVLNLNIINNNLFLMAILVIIFYFLYKKFNKKIHPLKTVLALLLPLFILIGNSYEIVGSYNLIFSNILLFLISIVQYISYFFFFKSILSLIDYFLSKRKTIKLKDNKVTKLFKKHPFLFSLITILIFWSIYMIAFYPLILSKDPSYQIMQFFNVKTKYIDYVIPLSDSVNITNHHPVFHTMLLGGSIKLGRLFGSDNFGLFIYGLGQSIILASALALTVLYLYKKNKKTALPFVLIAIYSLVPMFPFYAMSAVKDTLYTAMIIFFVIALFKCIEKEKLERKDYLLLFIISLLLCLLRNNGIYITLFSLISLLIFKRKKALPLLLVIILLFGSYYSYDKVLLKALKITDGSTREMLSVPFQQTARYVFYHEDEVTPSEKDAIDKVLDYETLKERYNPKLADPVKDEYNKYTTKEELEDYFKVWLQQLFKHPATYIEATLNNTYGYYYINTTNWYIYTKYNKLILENNLVDYHYNSLSSLRKILTNYGESFRYIPLIGLISNIGFAFYMLLLASIYLLASKNKKYIIALIPLLLSFLICLISPANTYFRYSMPYVFLIPFIISYTYLLLTDKK